jgi:hypothetical protein
MKYNISIMGKPSETRRLASSDIAQNLPDDLITNNSSPAIAVTITCEAYNLRFSLNSTPTQSALSEGHLLYVGQSMRITNGYAIKNFSFINATNGENAIIQVTPEFEIGV